MPKLNIKSSQGFTLIELLIVIALLAVLALGLLAAIDPIEQINRGHDSAVLNFGSEFYQAEQRYYTNNSTFTAGILNWSAAQVSTLPAADITTLTTTQGELKSSWTSQNTTYGASVYVTCTPAGATCTTLAACYKPLSKANIASANCLYTTTGALAAAAAQKVAGCAICIQ